MGLKNPTNISIPKRKGEITNVRNITLLEDAKRIKKQGRIGTI